MIPFHLNFMWLWLLFITAIFPEKSPMVRWLEQVESQTRIRNKKVENVYKSYAKQFTACVWFCGGINLFGRKSVSTISDSYKLLHYYWLTLTFLFKWLIFKLILSDYSLLRAITRINWWASVGHEETKILVGSSRRDIKISGPTLSNRPNLHPCIWVMYKGLQQKWPMFIECATHYTFILSFNPHCSSLT